jgi:uncharacterized protein YhbP (UPF0306 family)
MNFLQLLSAQAQQARKIYTSAASKHDVSTLFRIDYITRITHYLKKMGVKSYCLNNSRFIYKNGKISQSKRVCR